MSPYWDQPKGNLDPHTVSTFGECQNVNLTYHEIYVISKLVDIIMMICLNANGVDNDHSEEMPILSVTEPSKTELCFIWQWRYNSTYSQYYSLWGDGNIGSSSSRSNIPVAAIQVTQAHLSYDCPRFK